MGKSIFFESLGLTAAIISLIQAIVWTGLSLSALLLYMHIIECKGDSTIQFSDLLCETYFRDNNGKSNVLNNFTPSQVNSCVWVYFVLSIAWIFSSGTLVFYIVKKANQQNINITTITWISVTYGMCILDFVVCIMFALDYNKSINFDVPSTEPSTKTALSNIPALEKLQDSLNYLTQSSVSATMMSIAARGYVLWLVNLVLAGFMTKFIYDIKKTDSQEPVKNSIRPYSSALNAYEPFEDDRYSNEDPINSAAEHFGDDDDTEDKKGKSWLGKLNFQKNKTKEKYEKNKHGSLSHAPDSSKELDSDNWTRATSFVGHKSFNDVPEKRNKAMNYDEDMNDLPIDHFDHSNMSIRNNKPNDLYDDNSIQPANRFTRPGQSLRPERPVGYHEHRPPYNSFPRLDPSHEYKPSQKSYNEEKPQMNTFYNPDPTEREKQRHELHPDQPIFNNLNNALRPNRFSVQNQNKPQFNKPGFSYSKPDNFAPQSRPKPEIQSRSYNQSRSNRSISPEPDYSPEPSRKALNQGPPSNQQVFKNPQYGPVIR